MLFGFGEEIGRLYVDHIEQQGVEDPFCRKMDDREVWVMPEKQGGGERDKKSKHEDQECLLKNRPPGKGCRVKKCEEESGENNYRDDWITKIEVLN